MNEPIRPPAVSGRFYPSDAGELARAIDGLLESAAPEDEPGAFDPLAIVVPHAAYVYSGSVAARAWRRVEHLTPDVIVLIGPDHFTGYPHVAIHARGAFATPLGDVSVDEELADLLLSAGPPIHERPEVHHREHSLEVQVPFVQRLFPKAKIVPILMGYRSGSNAVLADALVCHLPGRNALLVASSDLSHYHPRERASVLDGRLLQRVEEMTPGKLRDDLDHGQVEACGGIPIVTVLDAAGRLGGTRASILEYADSGQVNGDLGSVVGYAAVAVEANRLFADRPLTSEDKARLLSLARDALSGAVSGEEITLPEPADGPLGSPKGAFVTIRRDGQLRGCVGFNQPLYPLAETVVRAARAAVADGRFSPVATAELGSLSIEISILGDLVPCAPQYIEIGRHGLFVSMDDRRGLFLPQVPVEHGWSRDQYLSETCLKAGLPADAWRNGARLELFDTVVIRGGV